MKKAKILSTVALLGFAGAMAVSLAACGTGGGDGETNPTLPEGDPDSQVTIDFWHCMGQSRTANVEKIVDEFNEKWAGKYYVKLTQAAGSYDDLHEVVLTRLTGGEVPALAMAYPDSIAEYITNDEDWSSVYRVDNYIADEELGYTDEELDDFVDIFLDEGKNYQFEGTWSMPFYKSTEIMYYNQCYFDGRNDQNYNKLKGDSTFLSYYNAVVNAGDAVTDEELAALRAYSVEKEGYVYDVPTTWDEMVEVGRQMIADRAAENITSTEFYPVGYDSDANLMISQMAQRDIPYTTNEPENDDAANHFLFNNDQAVELLTEITDLINEKVLVTGETSGVSYTNSLFTEYKTAMTIGSTGGSSYNVSSNFRVGLAPVPYSNGSQQYVMQGPSICFFIQNDPYIQKGAWLFYKAMAETEANTALALESSYDPVRDSCYETDTYLNWIAEADLDLSHAITAATSNLRDKYFTSPVFVGSSDARDNMDSVISAVIAQNYTPTQALQNAYNACVAEVI